MKVQVIIESGDDGVFDANMEFIDTVPFGLFGQGKTVSDTIDDFYNSYDEIRAMYKAEGNKCPELEFHFEMPSLLNGASRIKSDLESKALKQPRLVHA